MQPRLLSRMCNRRRGGKWLRTRIKESSPNPRRWLTNRSAVPCDAADLTITVALPKWQGTPTR